jgi:hypothetical protein
MSDVEPKPIRFKRWILLFVLVVEVQTVAVSCRSLQTVAVAPQGWNQTRGPVIPHDHFPTDCTLCHEKGSWHKIRADFQFDHAAQTGIPLFGAHARAECLRCHNDRGPVGQFARQGCIGCHQDVHRGQLGHNCQDCHGQADWTAKEQIARHNRTSFPLVGVHAGVACFRCHPGAQVGNFARAPNECAFCHQQDLARATTPNHQQLGWTQNCQQCHSPTDWHSARFHHARFPLVGAHAAIDCARCHQNQQFNGLSQDCFACHAAEYQATTQPNHATAGFSTDCKSCHSPIGWQGSGFVHSKFPLSGAHAAVACASCHKNNVYAGLPHDCFNCHAADYQRTTNPNHAASNFPHTCQNCHDTAAWNNATFNHTFNINSGPHSRLSCAECHRVASNFAIASCTHCHEHQQLTMDQKHREQGGYSWSSPACIQCHPDGRHD